MCPPNLVLIGSKKCRQIISYKSQAKNRSLNKILMIAVCIALQYILLCIYYVQCAYTIHIHYNIVQYGLIFNFFISNENYRKLTLLPILQGDSL